jgi:serine/threonine protein kinase/Tol biopolymer transport system component
MSLASGARIGPYVVSAQIGAGGMGEVYRATDSALRRDVAVKVLPGGLATDSDRLARFKREAQVLASLNHPHIAQVYGFEQSGTADAGYGPVCALVMELVDGPTLADRIARGPVPAPEAMSIASQIADALQAAHDQGIVHRDLKPANIKVRTDGVVKVLDFGLAKLHEPAESAPGNVSLPETATSPAMTRAGVILGTASYMSPEQARGQAVDKRADIWAFGCVVYEMLTGTQAFAGDTLTDVLAKVVGSEPDLSRVPAAVRPLLKRCLEKDVRRRLRDIGDATVILEAASHRDETPAGAEARRTRHSPAWMWGALMVTSAIALGISLVHFRERTEVRSRTRVEMTVPAETTSNAFRIAPDGASLLLQLQTAAGNRLAIRSLATGDLRELPGTTGSGPGMWSRDGRSIAFAAGGALKRIAAAGGAPQTLVERGAGANAGCWANGEVVFHNDRGGFSRVAETGGDSTVVTVVDRTRGEIHHESASCLPDGRFLYFRHLQERGASGIYVGVTTVPADKQSLTPVLVADDGPLFVPGRDATRHQLLFMKGATLFAQDFRPDRLELTGEPRQLADNAWSALGSVTFAANDGGVLVFRNANDPNRQLTWVDRDGTVSGTLDDVMLVRSVRIAPDGSQAAVGRFPPGTRINNDDIWIAPFTGAPMSRLTSGQAAEVNPVWAPDGTRIAFFVIDGVATVHQQTIGSSTSKPISTSIPAAGPLDLTDWSKDQRFILMTLGAPQTRNDIWILPVMPGAPGQPIPLVQTASAESTARFSPDGRWIAYVSDESGRNEVYVRTFVVAADGSPSAPEASKRMISTGARGGVRWRRDGRELLYLAADGRMMAAEVKPGGELRVEPPRPLFPIPAEYLRSQPGAALMDMLPDASRFLIAMPPREAPRTDLQVVLNWR